MSLTLLLDPATWDLMVDVDGNIAVCGPPYQLAQDAASAMRTFQGEVRYAASLGVPYLTDILGKCPPLSLVKADLSAAAKSVDGVTGAKVFLTAPPDRELTGQAVITDAAGGTFTTSF